MAAQVPEVSLLKGGIDAASPPGATYVQNMIFRAGGVETRKGFGQLAQIDISLLQSQIDTEGSVRWGVDKHLGSHIVTTNFGHRQLVSAFLAISRMSDEAVGTSTGDVYAVVIYDLTTGEWWDEILYRHTASNDRDTVTMAKWHGNYESDLENDHQSWVLAEEEPWFFEEYNDLLFLGSSKAGAWVYAPAAFQSNRLKMTSRTNEHEWADPYSEGSLLSRARLVDGPLSDGYAYFTDSDVPSPTDVTVMGERLVWAHGRQLFFSDLGYPTSIVSGNNVNVPSQGLITAVISYFGNLLIFTEDETWLYRPNAGFLVSSGQMTQLSQHVGCVGKHAVMRVEEGVIWVDRRGVYRSSGNMSVDKMSTPLNALFDDHLTNMLTSYFPQDGATSLSDVQPNTTLQFNPSRVSMTYDHRERLLLVSIPEEKIALCLSEGEWSVWSFESIVKVVGTTSYAGITSYIDSPFLIADSEGLYLLGSPDSQTLVDEAEYRGDADGHSSVEDHTVSRSFYLLEYGRGGRIDRSVAEEDDRLVQGYYHRTPVDRKQTGGYVYFDPPWKCPVGYTLPDGTVVSDAVAPTYLLPICIVPPEHSLLSTPGGPHNESWSGGPTSLDLTFYFDNTMWRPLTNGVRAEIYIVLPPERLGSVSGWGDPFVAGLREARVYVDNTGGAALSSAGAHIRLHWDGDSAIIIGSQPWTAEPHMNLVPGRKNPLMWIPMTPVTNDKNTSGFAISDVVCELRDTTALFGPNITTDHMQPVIWEQWTKSSTSIRRDDSVAQPVDWCYATPRFGEEGDKLFKSRGLYLDVRSRGEGTEKLEEDWVHGLLNTLSMMDRRGQSAQIIDHTGLTTPASGAQAVRLVEGITSILPQIADSGDLLYKVFKADDVVYGDSGVPATGNCLIDDEHLVTISVSDVQKGHQVQYMLFGHVQNRAEALRFTNIRMAVHVQGGRRRHSHE